MGVYINNMPMPRVCKECFALDDRYDYPTCKITSMSAGYTYNIREKRMQHCPMTEVQDVHGDLIDRDELRKSIKESIDECYRWANEVDNDTMMHARISQALGTFVECSLRAKEAPVVVPATEEET